MRYLLLILFFTSLHAADPAAPPISSVHLRFTDDAWIGGYDYLLRARSQAVEWSAMSGDTAKTTERKPLSEAQWTAFIAAVDGSVLMSHDHRAARKPPCVQLSVTRGNQTLMWWWSHSELEALGDLEKTADAKLRATGIVLDVLPQMFE